jgi:F-type H+-transporting ATPase subunit delta
MARVDTRAAKRYARAFFDATADADLEKRQSALEALTTTWEQNAELQEALLSPMSPLVERVSVMEAITNRLMPGEVEFENFGVLLVLNGRLPALPEIAAIYAGLVKEYRQVRSIEITSAFALDGEEQSRIQHDLEAELQARVAVTWQVDPEIIGGLIVRLGDRQLDSSIKSALEKARTQLLT